MMPQGILSEGFRKYKKRNLAHFLRAAILLILPPLIMLGCKDPEQQQKLDQIVDNMQQTLTDATNNLGKIAPSPDDVQKLTTEEIEKLYIYEYHVQDIDMMLPPSEVSAQLMKLGIDRWECFNVVKVDTWLRVFCKRHPKTYLRYLPRVF